MLDFIPLAIFNAWENDHLFHVYRTDEVYNKDEVNRMLNVYETNIKTLSAANDALTKRINTLEQALKERAASK
jgi:cell division septum initiation protein DivIVA